MSPRRELNKPEYPEHTFSSQIDHIFSHCHWPMFAAPSFSSLFCFCFPRAHTSWSTLIGRWKGEDEACDVMEMRERDDEMEIDWFWMGATGVRSHPLLPHPQNLCFFCFFLILFCKSHISLPLVPAVFFFSLLTVSSPHFHSLLPAAASSVSSLLLPSSI